MEKKVSRSKLRTLQLYIHEIQNDAELNNEISVKQQTQNGSALTETRGDNVNSILSLHHGLKCRDRDVTKILLKENDYKSELFRFDSFRFG